MCLPGSASGAVCDTWPFQTLLSCGSLEQARALSQSMPSIKEDTSNSSWENSFEKVKSQKLSDWFPALPLPQFILFLSFSFGPAGMRTLCCVLPIDTVWGNCFWPRYSQSTQLFCFCFCLTETLTRQDIQHVSGPPASLYNYNIFLLPSMGSCCKSHRSVAEAGGELFTFYVTFLQVFPPCFCCPCPGGSLKLLGKEDRQKLLLQPSLRAAGAWYSGVTSLGVQGVH